MARTVTIKLKSYSDLESLYSEISKTLERIGDKLISFKVAADSDKIDTEAPVDLENPFDNGEQ